MEVRRKEEFLRTKLVGMVGSETLQVKFTGGSLGGAGEEHWSVTMQLPFFDALWYAVTRGRARGSARAGGGGTSRLHKRFLVRY